jgi:Raf kinase inhibitor-like YbhB/YbcL family protein
MLRSISVFLALALSLMAVGCGGGEGGGGEGGVGQQQFTLSSTAFRNNGAIPLKYASAELGGQDVSPPLQWSNPPAGTRSFVITCIDLDADGFVHWVVYDIPANLSGLPENVPKQPQPQVNGAQVKQGQNEFGGVGYGGPEPPQGERTAIGLPSTPFPLTPLTCLQGQPFSRSPKRCRAKFWLQPP